MATYTHDVVVYSSNEDAIIFAVAVAETHGATVALISETQHFGGITGGMLGVQDFGNPLDRVAGSIYERYLIGMGLSYGMALARVVIPGEAERAFVRMLARAGVDVFHSRKISSAAVDGGGRVTSITMTSGDVFEGTVYYDASACLDLVQAAGTEAVTWAIGTEPETEYGESKGGFRSTILGSGDSYLADGVTLNVLSIDLPGYDEGDAWDGVQAYAHRELYKQGGFPFAEATIKQLNDVVISVIDPSIYDADVFAFYGLTRTGERTIPMHEISGGGRRHVPDEMLQDNDDIPLVAAGRPRHWDYGRFNKIDPDATYTLRTQYEYDQKLFMMQSRAWMATDARYSGAWQDSMADWGWPQRDFRGNDGIPYRLYIREAARAIGDYVITQDDLTVATPGPGRNIFKDDAIALGGYPFDTHISAFGTVDDTSYKLLGKTTGAPDTNEGGYAIPWGACFNSLRPNLLHVPAASHLAWSSVRIITNLALAAEGCAIAAGQMLDGSDAADVDIGIVQTELTARGLLFEPL